MVEKHVVVPPDANLKLPKQYFLKVVVVAFVTFKHILPFYALSYKRVVWGVLL